MFRGRRVIGAALATASLAGLMTMVPQPWVPAASAAPQLAPGSPASDITYAPVRPANCTAQQLANLDIENCAVYADGTPSKHGFPVPPFPGNQYIITPIPPEEWVNLTTGSTGPIVVVLQEKLTTYVSDLSIDGKFGAATTAAVKTAQLALSLPDTGIVDAATAAALEMLVRAELPVFPGEGWNWNGNSWSGSPALAEWEARLTKVTVRTDPIASGLFEGFLADVRRGTHRIDESGTYAFRCTATTVRNCRGMSTASLSYHAWGLAVDLNYTTNPLQMVTHATNACTAPTQHAVPDWILKSAQRWGLFWGGWYSCPKPGGRSVVKDPHHFEYRGTPELAAAIIAKNTAPGAEPTWVPGIEDLLLHCGDRGAAVGQLRELLPAAYRPTESASLQNTFTAALATAVGRLQLDRGLPVTEVLDAATARSLGITVRHTEVFPVLHRNSCGTWVIELQKRLGVTPVGTIGSTTMSKLRTWQRANGLAPTGITDTSTAAALGLVLPTPPNEPPPDPPNPPNTKVAVPLAFGARNASVSALQRALTAAGHPTPVTGRFGSVTARSLRAFQRARGLSVSSTLSIATAEALGLTPTPRLPVRYGQSGDSVRLIQSALIARGTTLRRDGRFGAATKRAVMAFQRSAGLPATGVVNRATASALGF